MAREDFTRCGGLGPAVRDFIRALASLGGFLGRKCDGEPGWQTIWNGLDTLILCIRGDNSLAPQCG